MQLQSIEEIRRVSAQSTTATLFVCIIYQVPIVGTSEKSEVRFLGSIESFSKFLIIVTGWSVRIS